MDVGSNHLLAVDIGLADPASTTSDIRGSDQIGVGLESAGDTVHEVGLVELGEDRCIVVRLEGVVGHLAGVGTGQEVALVRGVHDESTALGSTTEGTDMRVS